MSSKVNDFLHELIHSLTKSEKRYFKLLSSRHTIGEENNYIVLFDFIDKQEKYDEKEIQRNFKGENFLNKLSITKKRLYDHILNALDNFYSQSNVESQIFKMIHSADILSNKSLYDQARKLLYSAEKLAEKNELTNVTLHIRIKLKALLEKNNYIDIRELQLQEIFLEDQVLQNRSREESTLWNLKSQLFQYMTNHGIARTEEDKNAYSKFLNELGKITVNDNSRAESKYLHNHILSAYYFSIQNLQKSLEALQENLKLFQLESNFLKNHLDRYFSTLTNLIYTADSLSLFELANSYFEQLKNLEKEITTNSQDIDLQMKVFSSLSSIELSLLTKKGNFLEAKNSIPKIEDGMRIFYSSISPIRKAFLWFKIASIHLANNEPQLALKSIRKILNDSELDKKEDIVSFAHLLELFIHIELDDYEYLNYAVRSTKRFLTSRNRLFQFEHELLSFASKLSTTNKFDRVERWEKHHQNLTELTKDPFQASGLEYFDFLTWAESKMKKISFSELSRNKFLQKLNRAA